MYFCTTVQITNTNNDANNKHTMDKWDQLKSF